jgi:hypothetical protein
MLAMVLLIGYAAGTSFRNDYPKPWRHRLPKVVAVPLVSLGKGKSK